MSILTTEFGIKDGKMVYLFTLDNGNGLRVGITNYGGIVKSLIYKGVDVVLGRDTLEEYYKNNGFFGALIGRNSNRIEGAAFTLSGKEYTLNANDGRNNLHGGNNGFDKRVWDAKAIDGDEPCLELYLTSPDGDEGFPGEVRVRVRYTLTQNNGIVIDYEGVASEKTVLNMTNHSYFNLNGHNNGTIKNHTLTLNADFYTPNTDECIPNGEILSVSGTAFDFTSPKKIGEAITSDEKQIAMFNGLDHNMIIRGRGYRKAAELEGDITGIRMEVYTDQSGIQVYTGNSIEKNRASKDGAVYTTHSGICLETQAFPNNLRFSHFRSAILDKGSVYNTRTEFRFL